MQICGKSYNTICVHLQVLQNLGKADKTSDAAFEQHVLNFNDQQVFCCLPCVIMTYLQCFDTVDWASGRASSL